MRCFLFRATLLWIGLLIPGLAPAQDVRLTSPDGALQIEGTLRGYDSEFYRVETAYGALMVDATAVSCDGIGCPELGSYVAQLRLGGAEEVTARLIPALVQAYALERGFTLTREITSDRQFSMTLGRGAEQGAALRIEINLDWTLDAADAVLVRGEVAPERRGRVIALDARMAPDGAWLSDQADGASLARVGSCGRRVTLDRARLKSGDHPDAVPISLVTRPGRLPREVRDWMAWLEGAGAARVVRRLGFADLQSERVEFANQGERLRNAILAAGEEVGLRDLQTVMEGLAGAVRLTPTLRFAPGAVRPDTLSDSLIQRLARDLEAGLFDGQELLLVGFSDGQGPASGNRRISLRRAEAVRDLLRARAPLLAPEAVRLTALGFGEALPMACDEAEAGRRINRRVEVWLRPRPTDTPPPEN